ncbi:hypothetical protein [Microvirga mediterraneensis]|uniref:Uncharacterized protein n=1 Tax=Microvirga mediterraneensis TaxID=2754695 RepID=A0A838BMN7_9HYPH|nr:hypothetical protein [Microvirga mediterraneensis]MBA1156718.1 hypothetical protein [Microvirga mediterraneensis]
MRRLVLPIALAGLAAATSVSAQGQNSRQPPVRNGEVVIPSQKALERDSATQPRNDFSTNDATATEQMNRQNQRIDKLLEKGICTGCR